MNVAVFTDNDFGRVDSVTTTLRATLRYAPPTIRPCVYAASEFDDEGPGYFALQHRGTAVPFCGDLRVFLPQIRVYLDRARLDRIDLVHTTTTAAGNAEAFADAAAPMLRDAVRQRCMASPARAHALDRRWETTLAPLYDAYLKTAAVGRQPSGARRPLVDASDSAVTQLQ